MLFIFLNARILALFFLFLCNSWMWQNEVVGHTGHIQLSWEIPWSQWWLASLARIRQTHWQRGLWYPLLFKSSLRCSPIEKILHITQQSRIWLCTLVFTPINLKATVTVGIQENFTTTGTNSKTMNQDCHGLQCGINVYQGSRLLYRTLLFKWLRLQVLWTFNLLTRQELRPLDRLLCSYRPALLHESKLKPLIASRIPAAAASSASADVVKLLHG